MVFDTPGLDNKFVLGAKSCPKSFCWSTTIIDRLFQTGRSGAVNPEMGYAAKTNLGVQSVLSELCISSGSFGWIMYNIFCELMRCLRAERLLVVAVLILVIIYLPAAIGPVFRALHCVETVELCSFCLEHECFH